jgi:hypothetical protein
VSLDVYLYATVECPHCDGRVPTEACVFSANITHNLGAMASEAGLYKVMWLPDEASYRAEFVIPVLQNGLNLLRRDPERFRKLSPENGWGTYEGLVSFVEEYLAACREHPTASVRVSR